MIGLKWVKQKKYLLPQYKIKVCIKYQNFTEFSGMEILRKDIVSEEFQAIHPKLTETVRFHKISTAGNYVKIWYFMQSMPVLDKSRFFKS